MRHIFYSKLQTNGFVNEHLSSGFLDSLLENSNIESEEFSSQDSGALSAPYNTKRTQNQSLKASL